MPRTRSARSSFRRLALLVLAAGMVATTGAGAVFEALADHYGPGAPVHVESPEDDGCPDGHNHLFCQVARSLSGSATAPRPEARSTPAPVRLVSIPSVPERGPPGPAFLTDCVVPRGPPLG